MSDTQDPQEPGNYGQTPYPPPPPGAPGQPHPGQPGTLTPADEKLWSGMAHWGALVAGMVVGLAFLAPLLVLVIKGNASPWVRRNAVESLNFQLSMLIYFIVSVVLIFVLIGILTTIALAVAWLVFTIIGAVKANNGEDYQYPLTIRMVS